MYRIKHTKKLGKVKHKPGRAIKKKEKTNVIKVIYDVLFIIGVIILILSLVQRKMTNSLVGLVLIFVAVFIYEISSRYSIEKKKLNKFFRSLSLISTIVILGIVSYILFLNKDSVMEFFKFPLEGNMFFYTLIVIWALSLGILLFYLIKRLAKLKGKVKIRKVKHVKIEHKAEKKVKGPSLFSKIFKKRPKKHKIEKVEKIEVKHEVEKKVKKPSFFSKLFKKRPKKHKVEKIKKVKIKHKSEKKIKGQSFFSKLFKKKNKIKKPEKPKGVKNKTVNLYGSVFIISMLIAIVTLVFKEFTTFLIALTVMLVSWFLYIKIKKEKLKAKQVLETAKKIKEEKKEAQLPFKRRPLIGVFFLSIISGGSYFFYWYYSINKEIKEHMKLNINPMLHMLGMLVPGLNLYLLYKTVSFIKEMEKSHNSEHMIHPIATTIFALIFFPMYAVIVQYYMNKHLDIHLGKIKLKEVIFPEREKTAPEKEKKEPFSFFKKKTKEAYQESVGKRRIEIKPEPYETDIDLLKRLIDEKEKIKIIEVANYFGISKELAEEWGKILEANELAKLHYPTIGDPELKKWKKQ